MYFDYTIDGQEVTNWRYRNANETLYLKNGRKVLKKIHIPLSTWLDIDDKSPRGADDLWNNIMSYVKELK
ncbi:MAG: hypothetical protein FWD58_08820 [Firmicutes bacterium]|nr:hypothetical protein [Bacillota bacterium]